MKNLSLFHPPVLAFLLIALPCLSARGEYRVFELRIYRPDEGTERLVTTQLDHLQYPGYYPLQKGEQIEIASTWFCAGNTGKFKPICPKPTETTSLPETSLPKAN
ncbi:MAG: hypothetical protein KDD35_10710 [Bdellovibrionales bacterium]|nr:hypothetical protein [Bdellovibrionales bacterium]